MSTNKIRGLGWIHPRALGRLHVGARTAPASNDGLSDGVDLREAMPPIYSQGWLGSCTAQALVAAVEYLLKRIKKDEERPSRLDLYYAERALIGTIMEDSGALLADGLLVLNRHGWMPESAWPYSPEHFTEPPPYQAVRSKHTRRLINYEPLMHDATTLRWELSAGNPVAAGIMVYENFEAVGSDGELGMPEGRELGGHAVLLVGYRSDGKFLVRNSWGTDYGDHGHCWIPEAYLTDPRECGELHALRAVRMHQEAP